MDDPRNTDNAWIETVAVSIHFQDQNDMELKRLEELILTGQSLQQEYEAAGHIASAVRKEA